MARVIRAGPRSRPAVHAPGAAPARTLAVVSAAMVAIAPRPSPATSSATAVVPSDAAISAQAMEWTALTGAAGSAMYAATSGAPLAFLAISRAPTGTGRL